MAYVPKPSPPIETLEQLRLYIEDELKAISRSVLETTELELRPSFVEPSRPRDGMIVYADGASWNPGGGAGVYARVSGAWVKL